MPWTLDFDPSATGVVYEMVWFNSQVFAFVYGGSGPGVWRRDGAGAWTNTLAATAGRGAIFNGEMYWAEARYIYRSADGTTWVTDVDFGGGVAYSHWSALGGDDTYLYAAMVNFQSVGGTTFRRRDTLGNWTANPAAFAAEPSHSYDITRWGGDVYWSAVTGNVRIYSGGAWANEPTLNNEWFIYFTLDDDGTLFAAGDALEVWRKNAGAGWTVELSVGGAWGNGIVCISANGTLYVAGNDGTDSRVYVRSGTSWSLDSTLSSVRFRSSMAGGTGDQFAGTNSCEFYILANPDVQDPTGSGLYPQALAVDGNGDGLYVALYDNNGNPIAVKVNLPLHHSMTGSRIFNPGAGGDAINIKTSEFTGDYLYLSGKFAANNDMCRRSIDGGTTITDIDGNWGADRAQPIGLDVNDDEHVLLPIDGATDDLVETEDASTWAVLDTNLPFDVSALALHDLDPNELFIGNIAAAAALVSYSPNNGGTWADITGLLNVAGGIANIEVV